MTVFLASAVIVLLVMLLVALAWSLIVPTPSGRFGFSSAHRTKRRAAVFLLGLLGLIIVLLIAQAEAT